MSVHNISVRGEVFTVLKANADRRGVSLRAQLDDLLADLPPPPMRQRPVPVAPSPAPLRHARTRPPHISLTSWLYELARRESWRVVKAGGSDFKRAQVRSVALHRLYAQHGIVIHEDGTRTP